MGLRPKPRPTGARRLASFPWGPQRKAAPNPAPRALEDSLPSRGDPQTRLAGGLRLVGARVRLGLGALARHRGALFLALAGRADEPGEERVRSGGAALELGVELAADE